jgi:hypothetical protein
VFLGATVGGTMDDPVFLAVEPPERGHGTAAGQPHRLAIVRPGDQTQQWRDEEHLDQRAPPGAPGRARGHGRHAPVEAHLAVRSLDDDHSIVEFDEALGLDPRRVPRTRTAVPSSAYVAARGPLVSGFRLRACGSLVLARPDAP